MLDAVLQWFCDNWLEVFGVISSLLFIYLEIKQRNSMWAVGFVSSAVYVVVFFQNGFFAFSALYVYFVAASVYGMYCWRYNTGNATAERHVCRLKLRLGIVLALITIVLFAGIGYVLDNYIESSNVPPYGEALAVALNIVATWMLARKILEQWLLWIFTNFFSAGLYFWCELYPTAGLFAVYGILSIVGWYKWKQSYDNQAQ